jgi:hypothetical protein
MGWLIRAGVNSVLLYWKAGCIKACLMARDAAAGGVEAASGQEWMAHGCIAELVLQYLEKWCIRACLMA